MTVVEDAWRVLSLSSGMAELSRRMGADRSTAQGIATGASLPTAQFVAAALLTFPMAFSDLFTVEA